MKKICVFLLISFYSFCADAQMTISGATAYTTVNNVYLPNANYSTQLFTGIGLKDLGTISYRFIDLSTSDAYWIVRKNNYWTIERHYGGVGSAVGLLYKSITTSNDATPPCNVIWQVWAGVWYSYGTGVPSNTGSQESTIVLAGDCVCLPMLSTEINPTNIRLAILNTANYQSFSNPHKGMFNYNTSLNVPMVYNGSLWNEILLNRNTNLQGWLSVSGSINLPITFPVSLGQSSVTMDETDNTFVNISSNIMSVVLPSAHTCTGRHYYLINHGSQNMNTSKPIKTGYSTQTNSILPQERFHIVSDGTYWHLAN